jgi:hypothetical protein
VEEEASPALPTGLPAPRELRACHMFRCFVGRGAVDEPEKEAGSGSNNGFDVHRV